MTTKAGRINELGQEIEQLKKEIVNPKPQYLAEECISSRDKEELRKEKLEDLEQRIMIRERLRLGVDSS